MSDRLDKRRLNESDFEFAREEIDAAAEAVSLLEERDDARAAYREARSDAKTRLDDRRDEADRLRDLKQLADVDFDVSLDPLQDRIEAYNTAVRTAFERFRTERSARTLFDLLTDAADRPLVGVDRPPQDLVEYVHSKSAGTEPLSDIVEYADYSPSKLEHYVDDPGALRTSVAVHQTYLDRLDAEPFCVDWPPAEAATLRARLDELAPLTRRLDSVFADDTAASDVDTDSEAEADDTADAAETVNTADAADIAAAGESTTTENDPNRIEIARRDLARFTRQEAYDRLREIAVATATLSDDEFERVASGAVEDDLAAVTDAIDTIETALAETDIE